MQHLDAQTQDALHAGDPAVVAYFREHLKEPCEVCEAFLAAAPGPGLLDGMTDAALLSLAPSREARLDEVGFARLRRSLRKPSTRVAPFAAIGMAAGLLLVAGLARLTAGGGDEVGLKGAAPISVELSAAVLSPGGEVAPLPPDGTLRHGATILLRYHATERGHGVLLVERAGELPTVLGTFPLQPGTNDLTRRDELFGFSTAGEKGPLRLWLVARAGQAPPDPFVATEVARGARRASALARAGIEVKIED